MNIEQVVYGLIQGLSSLFVVKPDKDYSGETVIKLFYGHDCVGFFYANGEFRLGNLDVTKNLSNPDDFNNINTLLTNPELLNKT